jgi:hypothetical protein
VQTSKFDAWVKKIMSTEAEEISCSECFELLPEVVNSEILHKPSLEISAKVRQHLNQCQVCQEEYEILRDIARMDTRGEDAPFEK